MNQQTSSGSEVIDALLHGGYEKDIITTIYGPAGSGKTNLALLAAIQVCTTGKKVIYVDTEGGFSITRLQQLCTDHKKVMKKIAYLQPTTFQEQKKVFRELKRLINSKIGLIVVDTIGMLYRLELGNEHVYQVNRELGKQLAYLVQIARKKKIPVLITNQVYANFNKKDEVSIVGGDLLRYSSKCLIELQITPNNKRRAILKKHRSIKGEKEIGFRIIEKGIEKVKLSRGFKLFTLQ
jgi:DNA repair protein RadB